MKARRRTNPDECNVFAIWRHFAPAEAVEEKRRLYRQGGLAYRDIKQELYDLLRARFDAGYQIFNRYLFDPGAIDQILQRGAEKAREIARPLLARIRNKIGID